MGDFSQKSALLLGILAWNLLYGLLFFGVWIVTGDGGEPKNIEEDFDDAFFKGFELSEESELRVGFV